MLTIRNRTLVSLRSLTQNENRTLVQCLHLETIRDKLRHVAQTQMPKDEFESLQHLSVTFKGGVMRATWPEAEYPVVYRFTSTAATQAAKEVLPGHFFKGLKELVALEGRSSELPPRIQVEKLAEQVWEAFALAEYRTADPRLVRTVRMKLTDDYGRSEVVQVIRSVHGGDYEPYSNLQFVQDILDKSGAYCNLPVLQCAVTDDGMRLRFAGLETGLVAMLPFDPDLLLNAPIPMVEAWNSETGRRRVGLRAGSWNVVDESGFGHWDEKTEYGWVHRGSALQIRKHVQSVFENLFKTADKVVEGLVEAKDILVEGAHDWLETELKSVLSERVIRSAQTTLLAIWDDNDEITLADVVDTLAGIAKDEDIFDAYDIEREASRLLAKGLELKLKRFSRREAL